MISMEKYIDNLIIVIIIHINIQNNTNIQKILRLVRKINNIKGIFVQSVVNRIEEVYDILHFNNI